MQRFSFYVRADGDLPDPEAVGDALRAIPGVVLAAAGDYRPGTWHDPVTGARLVIDLGEPPLEEDLLHPPRAYAGWLPLHLVFQVPLCGPHWRAVEAYAVIERLLQRLPAAFALDEEDTQEAGQSEPGPSTWSRPRALLGWERLHTVQIASRTDLAMMPRGDSLRLWRWRRERADSAERLPHLQWPEGLALRDTATGAAVPAVLWGNPTQPLALPEGAVAVVPAADGHRVVPPALLGPTAPAGAAGALRAEPLATLPAEALPVARFKPLDDEDWIDG
jgi:hypothetical protein